MWSSAADTAASRRFVLTVVVTPAALHVSFAYPPLPNERRWTPTSDLVTWRPTRFGIVTERRDPAPPALQARGVAANLIPHRRGQLLANKSNIMYTPPQTLSIDDGASAPPWRLASTAVLRHPRRDTLCLLITSTPP